MKRLSNLYQTMETLRSEGLPISEELENKARALEEEIIQKTILPILTEKIEPALKPVKRELVLVVDHIPGEPLKVHISRKRKMTEQMAEIRAKGIDNGVEHGTHNIDKTNRITRSPATNFAILFPDGTLIEEKTAVDTMIAAIQRIGVEKVRRVVEEYNLVIAKVPVISKIRDSKYGNAQHDLGNGWLVITHCANMQKKKFFDTVSDILHLGLKVYIK